MFTFQQPPYFFVSDLDSADAQVSQFTPLYQSKKFATRYDSEKQPLHYENRLLLEHDDIVMHLVAEQGRVVNVEVARIWDMLYYQDGTPIGAALIPPQTHQLNDYYMFTKIGDGGFEEYYFSNQKTLNQKQIHRHTELLSRNQDTGRIWLPEKDMIMDNAPVKKVIQYPENRNVSDDDFLQSAVVRYAKMGNPACLFAAAFWFRAQGRDEQAIHGFQKAAEKQFHFAWLELGLEYHEYGLLGAHPEKAVGCFRQAAYGGLPLANYHLALAYIDGVGTEQNDALALSHMHKAQEGGISAAAFALGLYYRFGSFNHLRPRSSPYRRLMPNQNQINHQLAAQFFFKAANEQWQDSALAAYYLAESYRTGTGVRMDKDYAREWYRKALQVGDIRREEIQSAAYYNGDVERLSQIADDMPFAAYLLGRMYWFGEFAPKDFEIAQRYLKMAANSGHSCAQDASQLLQNARDFWRTHHGFQH